MNIKTKINCFLIIAFLLIPFFLFSQPETERIQASNYKTLIFYVLEDSKYFLQIGSMSVNGDDKNVMTKEKNNWCPAISPDGTKIAFYSDRSGFINLWLMNIDGTGQKPLTNDKENITVPDLYNRGQIAWSKNSDTVIFLKKGDIWVVDKTGETPSALTGTHDINMFRLSPEGEKILFSREKTRLHNGFWSMYTDGTNMNQIVTSDIISPSFDWGDDSNIAYFNNRGICTITHIGLDNKFIKETYYPNNDITWSRSSKDIKQNYIAYISDVSKGPNIWITKIDGSAEKQVTFNGGFSPFWFPDGKYLLYVEGNDIYKTNIESVKESIRLTYYFKSYFPVLAEIRTNGPIIEDSGNTNEK